MNKIKTLSVYLECSLTCTKKDELKRFILMISKMGYQEFYLGLTDAYKIDEYPYFNYKRAYFSKDDLRLLGRPTNYSVDCGRNPNRTDGFHSKRDNQDFNSEI